MPVPAFGFSAGDLVSAIGLVRKISKALKRTGGASTEYQHAIIELEGLENVLRHLESLEPNQDNERHINAVRGMALACQLPLRDFLVKMEKYEASLGPFSSPQWFRGLPQKSKWAVAFAEEVEKTRALVAAKTVSISLLLAMDHSKSLSKMEANLGKRREKEHSELLSKVAEHRSTLDSIGERITNIEDTIQQATQTSDEKLEALSSNVEATKAAVMSFRGVGQQIMSYFSAFPLEMRDLLHKILQSNWQIYHILLSIQQSPTRSPTQSLDSNIQFEDAMGELIPLPYVYFRHWETFEGFLRSHFKGTIGEVKVEEGQYNILNDDKGRATVKKDHWTRSIDQGARLTMSMIMSRLRRAMGQCPRRSCTGSRFVQHHVRNNFLTCELCNLRFFAEAGQLEDIFRHVAVQDEEEQVAKKQLEEDLCIYGTRPEPPGAVDLDEDEQLSKLPPKRRAAEFEAGVDRPAKARKKSESQTYNYENVTAMDWNAGESPIMAWVNQSAVPAAIPVHTSQTDPLASKDEELLEQEEKEIEIFKNVHVCEALTATNNAKFAASLEYGSDLDFSAQIYYRNIIDRYPLLPPYLARRLAIANHNRAERLQQSRLRTETSADIVAEVIDAPPFQTRSISPVTKNVADEAPTIPIDMPEEKAATGSHRRKTLTPKERRLLREHHENFPDLNNIQLGAIFDVETCTVSRILDARHRLSEPFFGPEPPPVDRAQSKALKPLGQLDKSAPWSSWPENTEAASYPTKLPESPTPSNRHESHGDAVDKKVHSTLGIVAYVSGMLKPDLDIFSQDRCISPPMSSPPLPPQAPPDRMEMSSPEPEQFFWTGRRQSHRPSSVKSYGSSRNSSLHGSPAMDPSYQYPVIVESSQKHGSPEAGNLPRGLLPAPIDWTATQSRDPVSKGFSFHCEICGEVVKAERRKNWQNHVMSDLRPYTCTAEECSHPGKTYSSLRIYLRHEILSHEMQYSVDRFDEYAKRVNESITCLFCGQWTTHGRGKNSRGRHVGQHMEEIAFMVVPKAYEDWEFYSEASSGIQADSHTFYNLSRLSSDQSDCQVRKCEKINPSTGKPCNTVFSRPYDLTRHDDTIHGSRDRKARCQICTEEKTFSRRDALRRHMRVVHPDVDFRGKRWRRTNPSRKRYG